MSHVQIWEEFENVREVISQGNSRSCTGKMEKIGHSSKKKKRKQIPVSSLGKAPTTS